MYAWKPMKNETKDAILRQGLYFAFMHPTLRWQLSQSINIWQPGHKGTKKNYTTDYIMFLHVQLRRSISNPKRSATALKMINWRFIIHTLAMYARKHMHQEWNQGYDLEARSHLMCVRRYFLVIVLPANRQPSHKCSSQWAPPIPNHPPSHTFLNLWIFRCSDPTYRWK